MSNELELLVPSNPKEISSNSKVSQNTPKKEGSSLFDKMLSDAKSDIENPKEKLSSQTKANVKEVNPKIEVKEEKKEKTENIKENVVKQEVKTTSLMDRLVQETKANVKEVNPKIEVKTENVKEEKKEKTENTKENVVKQEVKTTITEPKINELVENTQEKVELPLENKDKVVKDKKTSESILNIKKENVDETSISQNIVKKDLDSNIDKIAENNKKNENTVLQNNKEQNLKDNVKENNATKISSNEVKNEKVANELSKLNLDSSNEKIELNKEEILSQKDTNKKSESLIDKILNENKKEIIKTDRLNKQNLSLEELLKNNNEQLDVAKSKNDLLTNIYMSSQKKSIDNKNLEIKHEGVQLAKNATSTKDIENSAKVLNLGLEKVEVKIEKPVEQQIETKLSSTFDRLVILKNSSDNSKNSKEQHPKKEGGSFLVQGKIFDDELKDSKLVNLTVSSAAAQTIQNRIIGARQQMAAMMSDMARVMYENYRPPVTAFRINLNPSSLGTIAVIIRNEQRNNSLSISMKATNSSTKESLMDNQTVLKDSLFKSFAGDATSFDLDFSDFDNSESFSDNQNMQNKEQNSNQSIASNKKIEESKVIEDNSYNYL
ncbi:hypothetical protein [Arcobacter sp.]|uniref:hypothetical protein n=2 Tax=Arcobacter sp. TaxID=1872629 RepID=UPI003D10E101